LGSFENRPVIIGGSGGSGTRVIAQLCAETGHYMGHDLNVAYDSKSFGRFLRRWLDDFVASKGNLSPALAQQMREEFEARVLHHRYSIHPLEARWGWKNPRNVFLFPFHHMVYPEAKIIHMVRDGRDMAFSDNQNQLRNHGRTVLGDAMDQMPLPLQSVSLWNTVNLTAAEYCEGRLGDRYLRVRLEDLCRDGKGGVARILAFLGVEGDPEKLAGIIQPPSSLGRWRDESSESVSALTSAAEAGLRKFDYLP
jgi:hypothetical protein